MSPTFYKASWTLRSESDPRWDRKGRARNKKIAWRELIKALKKLSIKLGKHPNDLKFSLMPKEDNVVSKVKESRVSFCLQNLKAAKEVAGGMRVGEININGKIFPIVLQRIVYGFVERIQDKKLGLFSFSLVSQKSIPKDVKKMGFDNLLISGNCFQFYVLINDKHIDEVFAAL